MTREDIVKQVQVRLDELSPFDDIEEIPSIEYIDNLLDSSTDNVFRLLPPSKLPAEDLSHIKVNAGRMSGEYYAAMPVGYIKIASIMFDAWKKPVIYAADDSQKKLQSSEITMGKPNKPVVEERKRGSLTVLHMFSVPDGGVDPPLQMHIIMAKKPENCPDMLVDAIAWQCAADVLGSLGKNAEGAQTRVLTHGI